MDLSDIRTIVRRTGRKVAPVNSYYQQGNKYHIPLTAVNCFSLVPPAFQPVKRALQIPGNLFVQRPFMFGEQSLLLVERMEDIVVKIMAQAVPDRDHKPVIFSPVDR